MIKKSLLFILSMVLLLGCQKQNENVVHFFYYNGCHSCHDMQEQLLSETFFDDYTVIKHDLDLNESQELYHLYMGDKESEGKLENVDLGYRMDCLGSLLVFDGYGAYLGYSAENKDDYLKDFKFLLNNQPLLECFVSSRF